VGADIREAASPLPDRPAEEDGSVAFARAPGEVPATRSPDFSAAPFSKKSGAASPPASEGQRGGRKDSLDFDPLSLFCFWPVMRSGSGGAVAHPQKTEVATQRKRKRRYTVWIIISIYSCGMRLTGKRGHEKNHLEGKGMSFRINGFVMSRRF
jgi:hypothetical protein